MSKENKQLRKWAFRKSPFKCPTCNDNLILKKILKHEDICPACDSPMIIRSSFTIHGQLRMRKYSCTNHECSNTKSNYDEINTDNDPISPPEDANALYMCENVACNSKYFVSTEEAARAPKQPPHKTA